MEANTLKKYAPHTAIGLNAAAIVFLYTTFVPQTTFSKMEQYVLMMETNVVQLKVDLAVAQTRLSVAEKTLDYYRENDKAWNKYE